MGLMPDYGRPNVKYPFRVNFLYSIGNCVFGANKCSKKRCEMVPCYRFINMEDVTA